MPHSILYKVCTQVFQMVMPFLANLHSTRSQKYLYMYSMTQTNFYFFFAYEYQKNTQYFTLIPTRWNNWKKMHSENFICQTCMFFVFSQQFRNQGTVKFRLVLIPIFKFFEEKVFCLQGSYTSATSQVRLNGMLGQTSIDVWPNTSFSHVWKRHAWNVFECDTVATVAEKLVYKCRQKKRNYERIQWGRSLDFPQFTVLPRCID